jgi:cellulose synthase/poly-beta-1,6-N-acetylglucosamine synthase-like glycosyltransferase
MSKDQYIETFLSEYSKIRRRLIFRKGLFIDAPFFGIIYTIVSLLFIPFSLDSLFLIFEKSFLIAVIYGILLNIVIVYIFYSKDKCQANYEHLEYIQEKLTTEERVLLSMFLIYTKSDDLEDVPTEKWEKFLLRTQSKSRISNSDLKKIIQ